VATRIALANQLRALLESFWPGPIACFADVASPIALAFLDRYPTPGSAARLGEKRVAAFLAQNQYSGRRTPPPVWARGTIATNGADLVETAGIDEASIRSRTVSRPASCWRRTFSAPPIRSASALRRASSSCQLIVASSVHRIACVYDIAPGRRAVNFAVSDSAAAHPSADQVGGRLMDPRLEGRLTAWPGTTRERDTES
jgi:hypothetical protein